MKSSTEGVPLYRIAQARSGDKNDVCDITVFLPTRELYEATDAALSAEAVSSFLAPLVTGPVRRYDLPRLYGYKFVCHGALGGGGSASLRSDNLGKSMAAALLRIRVPGVSAELAATSPVYAGPPRRGGAVA